MRRAIRVAVHFLQLSNAVVLEGVGESRAYSGVVLVIAGSFQLDRLAVQEEALLRVEFHRANAEGRLVTVDYIAASAYLGYPCVDCCHPHDQAPSHCRQRDVPEWAQEDCRPGRVLIRADDQTNTQRELEAGRALSAA